MNPQWALDFERKIEKLSVVLKLKDGTKRISNIALKVFIVIFIAIDLIYSIINKNLVMLGLICIPFVIYSIFNTNDNIKRAKTIAKELYPNFKLIYTPKKEIQKRKFRVRVGNYINNAWALEERKDEIKPIRGEIITKNSYGIEYNYKNIEYRVYDITSVMRTNKQEKQLTAQTEGMKRYRKIEFDGIIIEINTFDKNTACNKIMKDLDKYALNKMNGALVQYKNTNKYYTNTYRIDNKCYLYIRDAHIISSPYLDKSDKEKSYVGLTLDNIGSVNQLTGYIIAQEVFEIIDRYA